MSPIWPTAESSTSVRSSAYRRPVDLVAAGDDGDLAVVLGGQRDAGVRRDRGDRRDAGDDLEAEAGLDAGLRLLGTGGVEERVAGHQPDDAQALLGVLDDDLGARGVGQRLAVLAEAAVDELGARSVSGVLVLGSGSGRPSRPRTRSACSGTSVTTTSACRSSSTARTVSRSGVAGAAADERHPAAGGVAGVGGWWWSCLASCVLPLVCCRSVESLLRRRRASPSPAGSRRPAASAGSPDADIRTESPPSGDSATARTHSSSPSSPSTTSARAPIGAEQPPSSVASTARSASTAARVRGSSSASAARPPRSSLGAALDRQRTLPGGGQHLQRVEHLGHLVETADPGQPGAGEDDGVVLTGADLADPGVDVATNARPPPNRGRARAAARPAAGSRCRPGCRPAARRG